MLVGLTVNALPPTRPGIATRNGHASHGAYIYRRSLGPESPSAQPVATRSLVLIVVIIADVVHHGANLIHHGPDALAVRRNPIPRGAKVENLNNQPRSRQATENNTSM